MKRSFMLYQDQHPPVRNLSLEQKGLLFDALFAYNAGEEPEFADPVLSVAFGFFRQTFERDAAKYEQRCRKNRENIHRRYGKPTNVYDRSENLRSYTNAADSESESDSGSDSGSDSESESKKRNINTYSASAARDAGRAREFSRASEEGGGAVAQGGEGVRESGNRRAAGDREESGNRRAAGSEVAAGNREAAGDREDSVGQRASGNRDDSGGQGKSGHQRPGKEALPAPGAYLTRKKRSLAGKRLESFNRFWAAFAYCKGKAEAADAWLEIPSLTNSLVERICAAAEREAAGRPQLVAMGRSPKWAQGWLAARRWEDEAAGEGGAAMGRTPDGAGTNETPGGLTRAEAEAMLERIRLNARRESAKLKEQAGSGDARAKTSERTGHKIRKDEEGEHAGS